MATRSDGSGPGGTGDAFFRPSVRALTPYQPGKPVEDVQRELGLERVVKLASNEGPFGPFPAAEEALARRVRELNRYPDGGSYRLHAALAERHGVSFEQVCVGAGADGCIDMLSQATLDPGDEIVCGWPSFPSYVIYAAKQGAVPRTVELAEHRYDLDALLDAVTPRTKLVYICHPNNPTGTMNTTRRARPLFRARAGARPDRRRPGVLRVHRPSPTIRTPSSAISRRAGRSPCCAPSRRSTASPACVSATPSRPQSVCAAMAKVRRPFDITSPAQVAALASIGEDAELARRRDVNAEGLARLESLLREHGLAPVPSVGNFLYVDTGGDANALYERLLHEGVIVRPLTGFGSTTAIRVSVGAPDELDHLAVALARVLQPA